MMAKIENNNPPEEPTAKENQKVSFSPSIKKGNSPKIVDRMVKHTAVIL